MMEALVKRAEVLAGARQAAKVQQVAAQLRAMLGAAAVEVEQSRVVVSGRGLMKRWLAEPALRFLAGGWK